MRKRPGLDAVGGQNDAKKEGRQEVRSQERQPRGTKSKPGVTEVGSIVFSHAVRR